MRDLTLGQIWDTILKLWRSTYLVWKIVLACFAVVALMGMWIFVEPTEFIREGKHISGMSHMVMRDGAFPIMFVVFTYLFLYWLVRTVWDYCEKVQQ